MKVWVAGRLVDEADASVSVTDHGLTVGDGVFETVKVTAAQPFALTRHLQRLEASAGGLGLRADLAEVRTAVTAVLAAEPELAAHGRLRITLTGGPGPYGSDRGDAAPTLIVALAPLGGWPPTASVVTVPWRRNERSAVAGIKTTSYAENVVALAYAKARGGAEAVFANTLGNLCEGTGSNIFLVQAGRLLTPPPSSGCLAGVTRGLLLEWLDAEEADVPLAALTEADEVFLTSTTRDVQPVSLVDGRRVAPAPGPVTVKAMEVFAARAAEHVDP